MMCVHLHRGILHKDVRCVVWRKWKSGIVCRVHLYCETLAFQSGNILAANLILLLGGSWWDAETGNDTG